MNDRIKIKEQKRIYEHELEGDLGALIEAYQKWIDEGWVGLELESYYGDYNWYLYKFREETDKEYEKRVKQLEKEKADKAKAKERKLAQLKKELSSLSADEKKQLGL